MFQETFFGLIVKLVGETGISNIGLRCALEALPATFSQLFLENDDIFGVALVGCIGNVTHERDQANEEINKDVEFHFHLDTARQASLDRDDRPVDHQREEKIENIADTGNELVWRAPMQITVYKTNPGIKPITEPQPNRMPMNEPKDRSTLYALLLALVRTFSSSAVSPGGRARFLFFDVLYIPPNLVAGTVSKYGSCRTLVPSCWWESAMNGPAYLLPALVGGGFLKELLSHELRCERCHGRGSSLCSMSGSWKGGLRLGGRRPGGNI